ncbi:PEP-CTERM sorting domain-containing protein [Phycisphaera mikurensis]|uniref:PEP-CTERM protein-sorting domain-containing protein n=1 Tax=Phycisphaera mikurensis (strain NBRC 102666 / KCTC 22515 / FYK2301M01) TaxID=1142394 RepID=I0IJ54_PHYMF|nr:PEP-CTERM sorting domain-containing protein [Phycisphaera mikurensis]BAM05292.1 hypothetical protein PSMK_31330 [Phycisphaera mikurensis NBRC 102666]
MRRRHTFAGSASAALLAVAAGGAASAAVVPAFDLVDDFLKVGGNYNGPGLYDVFDAATGLAVADGVADIAVSVTATGLTADDGNNVSWVATTGTSGTGLVSTIDPSFVSGGGVLANNGGHRVTQTIQIDFLTLLVEASDVTDLSWSSGNSAGVVWEHSVMEFLDAGGNPFSPTPAIGSYATHTPVEGSASAGNYVADGLGSVTAVGTDLTVPGSNGSMDAITGSEPDTPAATGVAPATTLIGGIRFTHGVEDVRGVDNGDTVFTNTINDLDLVDFEVVPEPASALLLATGALLILTGRRN